MESNFTEMEGEFLCSACGSMFEMNEEKTCPSCGTFDD
jgi:rubrerythrin